MCDFRLAIALSWKKQLFKTACELNSLIKQNLLVM